MNSPVRKRWFRSTTALAAGVATLSVIGLPGVAEAKKSKKKKVVHVQLTGVKSLDKVFRPLKKLDKLVTKAQKARRKGAANINTALGLQQGTSLAAAMKHLRNKTQGKVKVTLSGRMPQLKATDALPSNIAAGLEAANTAIQSYADAISSLAKVPKQASKLEKKAQKMPAQLKNDILANPAQAITIAKNLGVVKDNIKAATQIPKRAVKVTKNLNKDLRLMVTSFGGKWPPI
jgi:hypothetical protein